MKHAMAIKILKARLDQLTEERGAAIENETIQGRKYNEAREHKAAVEAEILDVSNSLRTLESEVFPVATR